MRTTGEFADRAAAAADRAANEAGVDIRLVGDVRRLTDVCALLNSIWRPPPTNPLLTVEFARALSHAGNYVAGAFDGETLVGACVGFFAAPSSRAMHSHVAGVTAAALGRHIGWALKLHQRAWALEHGLSEITWTFDPLVRYNAYFNLTKLAAEPREYLIDFYGELPDEVNAGQGSDRLLLSWNLTAPRVVTACDGRRAVPSTGATDAGVVRAITAEAARPIVTTEDEWRSARAVTVDLPPDISALRREAPDLAREWRQAIRTVLGGLMADGWRVTDFLRDKGYVVERIEE